MTRFGNLWSVVLAGGEGSRLAQLTVGPEGRAVPKQYCSVNGGESLLQKALGRARAVAGSERTLAVVSAEHRCWWSSELIELPESNVVVQPCNRGTACGVMLPLMQVLLRDPEAILLVLPSDHVVTDEATLLDAMRTAAEHARREPDRIVLLGLHPERADTSLGWIAPSPRDRAPIRAVSRFIEKPSREVAEELVREGALWNSFIFAMRAERLYRLFQRALPWMTRMFTYTLVQERGGSHSERISRLYDRLPQVDFARAVLQEAGEVMRVVAVPPCGWTDVGTPDGVARCAVGEPAGAAGQSSSRGGGPPLDLVEALRAAETEARAAGRLLRDEG
jgi:mannose-1-phosphate guanylyltransferase